MGKAYKSLYGNSKVLLFLFHIISIGFHNAVMCMLMLSYGAIQDNQIDFPYKNNEKLNKKMAKVIWGLGFAYLFSHTIILVLIQLVMLAL